MTKQYRDYVEKLKIVCQQNELFRNPTELISYIDEEYSKLSKTRADNKKLLYLIVDNQLQKLKHKRPFTSRHSLQTDLFYDLEDLFHIDSFRAGDKYILAEDIREIIQNLTDDYYPKLSPEHGLRQWHRAQKAARAHVKELGMNKEK
jgi:hypothetical protein